MRACLSFFTALVLSLNVVFSAGLDICDVLKKSESHAVHVAHHGYSHDDRQPAGDGETNEPHFHDHAHPNFSFLLVGMVGAAPEVKGHPLALPPVNDFDSALQSPPYHPPKSILA